MNHLVAVQGTHRASYCTPGDLAVLKNSPVNTNNDFTASNKFKNY